MFVDRIEARVDHVYQLVYDGISKLHCSDLSSAYNLLPGFCLQHAYHCGYIYGTAGATS